MTRDVNMTDQSDIYEPWRKSFPLCRPFLNERADGLRFTSEFLEAMATFEADEYRRTARKSRCTPRSRRPS